MSHLQILEQYKGMKEEIVSGSVEDKTYQKHITHPDFHVVDGLYKMDVLVFPERISFHIGFLTEYKRKKNIYQINDIKDEGMWKFFFSQSVESERNSCNEVYSTKDLMLVPKHDFIQIALALIEKERNFLKI